MYFDYPLEQGLRRYFCPDLDRNVGYFDYPLEQGLRQTINTAAQRAIMMYFDYPLEQGLRQKTFADSSCLD